ncbi:MAG: 3-dehydroquinate synthase [Spirochaetaceae bacterium]|nr:3-dehydroquinate synthase [Spirochaetaceae bacterium]|tara:strand:- start:18831 stop:19979 length:1149 start_codon:yes stop_codon:yes gene_type:complete
MSAAPTISTESFESDRIHLQPGSETAVSSDYSIILSRDFQSPLQKGASLRERIQAMKPSRIFLLTEKTLSSYGKQLQEILEGEFKVHVRELDGGETGKHLDKLGPVYNYMIENGVDRKSLLIALGGGVVGDFAGFVAATILRGIPFVQVPTTVLAMVDSSVGGKVAVNTGKGKNMVGAFYHPRLVWCNLSTLETLPDPEWSCGLAEMAKHAMLESSGDLRHKLHESAAIIREPETLAARIVESMAVKAYVVARDEKESGLRACLNLGHTTAHGIESVTEYSRFSHGQAVSRGLVTALILSRNRGYDTGIVESNLEMMKSLKLPMDTAGLQAVTLWEHMKFDKKNVDGEIRFVLFGPEGLDLSVPVSFQEFSNAWSEQQASFG